MSISSEIRARRSSTAVRVVALVALLIAIAVVAVIILGGGSTYVIHARFADASELVTGDSVEIAGEPVGSVTNIGVMQNGVADVTLSISRASATPLHEDTRATIRALGQAGLTNRYVALSPGPAGTPSLRSGAVLPLTQTEGLVNYDSILDSFGPAQRSNVDKLIANSASVYAGSDARYFNEMLGHFDPALLELNDVTGQLANDDGAIADVIRTGAVTARAIASRSTDLMAAVGHTASTLAALASERQALADSLTRAPAVIAEADRTLASTRTAATALRPVLTAVPAAAGPLRGFLSRLTTTLPKATPVVSQLRDQLPNLRSTLVGLKRLGPTAVAALNSAGTALKVARPIVQVFRYYGPDLLLGVFQGLAGVATANYNQFGHYARLEFTQPYQTSLGGPFSSLLATPLDPNLFSLRTKLIRRCPGGNEPPAPDGSNPWIPDPSICTPADDTPLSVDFP
jgi:phospholipid/cholesterol/gamma-HCH transport system substrate-binding protein